MAVKKVARGRERRRSNRVDARLSMRVEGAADGGAQAQVVTESQNISSSGVYCMSSHFLPPLSKVQLTIVLPRIPGRPGGQELIKCDGIVVRCESAPGRRTDLHYQLACMFAELDPPRRARIDDFVTWRNLQALRSALAPAPRKTVAAKKKTAARKPTGTRTVARRTTSAARARRATGAKRTAR